jgi:hypothetical protein
MSALQRSISQPSLPPYEELPLCTSPSVVISPAGQEDCPFVVDVSPVEKNAEPAVVVQSLEPAYIRSSGTDTLDRKPVQTHHDGKSEPPRPMDTVQSESQNKATNLRSILTCFHQCYEDIVHYGAHACAWCFFCVVRFYYLFIPWRWPEALGTHYTRRHGVRRLVTCGWIFWVITLFVCLLATGRLDPPDDVYSSQ